MCLIIRCEPSKELSKELLKNMHSRNTDGWGMMWVVPSANRLEVEKNHGSKFEELWEHYQEVKQYQDLYIHLRMKTHGLVDNTNTHPYNCGHGIWMMHNGIIRIDDKDDKDKSDTWHFIEKIIRPILDLSTNPHKAIRSKKFRYLVEHFIGNSNRIVLGDRGGFVMFNKNLWHTIDNEKTGVKGLIVSNTYAWSANTFGKYGQTSYSGQRDFGGYGAYSGNSEYEHWDTDTYTRGPVHQRSNQRAAGAVDTIMYSGQFVKVHGDVYCDAGGRAWTKLDHNGFRRAGHLDSELEKLAIKAADEEAAKAKPVLLYSAQTGGALIVGGKPQDPKVPATADDLLPSPKVGPVPTTSASAVNVGTAMGIVENDACCANTDDPDDDGFPTDEMEREFNELTAARRMQAANDQVTFEDLKDAWGSYGKAEVESFVYMNPDNAVELLWDIIQQNNHANTENRTTQSLQ